jgi:hypothetical protein
MLDSIDPIESFRPDPDGKCLCGKKLRFADCCGSSKTDRALPYGLILKKKFLSDDVADKLVGYAEKQSTASDLAIFTESDEGAQESLSTVVNSDRVTSRIELGDKQSIIDKWIADVFYKLLAKHVGKKIRSFTTPDLMRYTRGGYYKAHSDADIFDPKMGIWKKVLDRDYSLLLYLNNDFEGGAVRFEHFNYTFFPEKGDLLIFPSDYLYLHEALLVTAGVRYVIVSWANVK